MNIWTFINSIIQGFLVGALFGLVYADYPEGRHPSYETGFSLGFLGGVITTCLLIWSILT